ncbi:Rhodopsin domain-containing protein [Madurella fahalii]|uniref:Rhodopsin domain-containing protein n=1 Tax=Madurella fahalii TaxID=1157608 RepID=A0ABQ0GGT2_9PEZI
MSNSGVWGDAPPGVNLAEHQNGDIIGSVVGIMVLGIAAVVLRMFTRLMKTGPGLAIDDYVIVFAAVMGVGTAVCCLISVRWGGGKHLWVVTVDEFTKLYQTTYAFVIVYITCISATKISILLFYRRIFGTNAVWYIVFALTCAHWAEVTITWLAGCRPISYYWRQYTDPTATGTCIDAPLFYFCNGVIGLVIDVAILLVPTPTIWNLRLPTTKKVFIGGILLLGGFVCIASAVRIVMMDQLVKSPDFTWAMSKVFVWSCCEPFIGIVCACLPTYAPLVRRLWRRDGYSNSNSDAPEMYVSEKSNIPKRTNWSTSSWKPRMLLRGEDEIELTVNASVTAVGEKRPKSGDLSHQKKDTPDSFPHEIMVTKDFFWSSSP